MQPLLKWVGGKRWLAPIIKGIWDDGEYIRLVEPFMGAGAVFFAIEPEAALLNDICAPLMNFYHVVANDASGFKRLVGPLRKRTSEEDYYKLRGKYNSVIEGWPDATREAALFFYLNHVGYQGLYRVNSSGGFNVPYGHYNKKVAMPGPDHIAKAADFLRRVELYNESFGILQDMGIGRNQLVYCDPPYYGSFDKYSPSGFDHEEHANLAGLARKWAEHGATVIVSNRDCKPVRKLYPRKWWDVVKAPSVQRMAPHNGGRKPELVLIGRRG